MKISRVVLFSFLFFATSPVFAAVGHGGHSGGGGAYSAVPVVNHISDNIAIVTASRYVTALVSQKKKIEGEQLDEGWLSISAVDKSISWKNPHYCVVAFARKDVGKTLYVLLSEDGQFYDANFTSEFTLLKD